MAGRPWRFPTSRGRYGIERVSRPLRKATSKTNKEFAWGMADIMASGRSALDLDGSTLQHGGV